MNINTVILATPWQYGVKDEVVGGDGEAWSVDDLNSVQLKTIKAAFAEIDY